MIRSEDVRVHVRRDVDPWGLIVVTAMHVPTGLCASISGSPDVAMRYPDRPFVDVLTEEVLASLDRHVARIETYLKLRDFGL